MGIYYFSGYLEGISTSDNLTNQQGQLAGLQVHTGEVLICTEIEQGLALKHVTLLNLVAQTMLPTV